MHYLADEHTHWSFTPRARLTTEQRVAAYGGPWSLTPRQRRRAAKKDRRAMQRPGAWVALDDGQFLCLCRCYPA
ncbi:hypothetical protein [Actinoplanes sp. NPDC051851]|uniref:hypothetical protein n=1 Tax=Actinoplanes sp. NPDC051851 TaxID=3154753 RepID=UPI0034196FA8